jgi:hypothetical protein
MRFAVYRAAADFAMKEHRTAFVLTAQSTFQRVFRGKASMFSSAGLAAEDEAEAHFSSRRPSEHRVKLSMSSSRPP